MTEYSINDLEQISGIKAHTLRIWEQRYGIITPNRSNTNIRNYNSDQLKQILNIALLRTHGHKISNIAKLSSKQIEIEILNISNLTDNFSDQMQALTTAMIDLDDDRFEKVMNQYIEKIGFESVMINIIYPFLIKIGALWTTGTIGPAQEHFITNLIRQKLVAAIELLPKTLVPNHKTIIMYLPEGETHEIGLLFAQYIFKLKKQKVIYLGQSLPIDQLDFLYDHFKPNFIFTAITSTPGPDKVQKYLDYLSQNFVKSNIIVAGYQVAGKNLNIGKNVSIISKIDDLMKIVNWL